MTTLRIFLFRLVFWIGSVLIVGTVPISALFGQRAVIAHSSVWTRFHRRALRIAGIRVRYEGQRPAGPALYACKHQAMLETLELQHVLDGPAMVLKEELARIPVWGWAARKYGAIVVDREASASAMRGMLREAEAAKAKGRSILIFPEGTRVRPGEHPELKPGFAGLYRMLKLPTVPIACDSGHVVLRDGGLRPGIVTFRYGETIPPGLPRAEIEARVHAAINALDG